MYNETDDDAFVDYELRDLATITRLVDESSATHVVLKPTVDGNRAAEIIDALPRARAIWIYRDFRDVIGSALVQFRETSLEYLESVADRRPSARWRSINITAQDIELIAANLKRGISEESARALIWNIRNGFFFRQKLHLRNDVILLNYEDLVRQPDSVVSAAYAFVGLEFRAKYTRSVFSSSIGRRPPPRIDPVIARMCTETLARLDHCRREGSRPPDDRARLPVVSESSSRLGNLSV